MTALTAQSSTREGADFGFRSFVFIASLLLAWISTAPFKGDGAENYASSNVLNQLFFTGLAIAGMAALCRIDGKLVRSYWRASWALMFVWILFSVFRSDDFAVSLRAFLFLVTVTIIAGASVLMPTGRAHFAWMIALVALVLLGLNYLGLLVWPDLAMHTAADRNEAQHAGSWRGSFDHKSIAGSMMGVLFFVGIFVFRAGLRLRGIAITALALVFLLSTRSKTGIGLAPAVLGLSLACSWVESSRLRTMLALGPFALMVTFTLGSVLLPPVDHILQALSPGQTYTGRTEIWGFALDRLAQRPIVGFGLETFWASDAVKYAEIGENETGISSGMPHGHNSFLDAAVHFGVVGLLLVAVVLVIAPIRDYNRARQFPENRLIADLMLQIWLFTIYSANLESFFFRRADPVWFALLFAVIYLRFLSRYRTAP